MSTLTTKDLFTRTFNLEREVLDAQELQKELKSDFTFDADLNTGGLPKDVVAKTMKAAKSYAKQVDLKEKAAELTELDSIIEENS